MNIHMCIPATRIHARGRASEGCYFGFKKDIKGVDCEFKTLEGATYLSLRFNNKLFWIIPAYINCNQWERDFDKLQGAVMWCRNNRRP